MVGLFMNFSRLNDKALREYDAARVELLRKVDVAAERDRARDALTKAIAARCP
jgi:hypothetical protein